MIYTESTCISIGCCFTDVSEGLSPGCCPCIRSKIDSGSKELTRLHDEAGTVQQAAAAATGISAALQDRASALQVDASC